MRLKNYTNISDDRIRKIIQFVKPNDLPTSNFDVRVTNTRSRYCGVFYEKGGYATKGVGGDPNGPLVVARVTSNEKRFPFKSTREPTRTVRLYFEQYNEIKGIWQECYTQRRIGISKAYIARKNRENRDNGKYYDWNKSTGGYIPSLILSREEALVYVLAHELRHFWQCSHPGKRGKVWGAKGRISNRDADAYAIKKTREWRRQHNNNCAGLESCCSRMVVETEQDHNTTISTPLLKEHTSNDKLHQTEEQELRNSSTNTGGSLSEIWNSRLVQSIRSEHASLTLIAQYEVEEMESSRDLTLVRV